MIVVDTSALIALLLGEPEATAFAEAIVSRGPAMLPSPIAFEFRLVMTRRFGRDGVAKAETLLAALPLTIAPWTAEHVAIAQDALLRFGGRPARLNFGDCMAYALARSLGAPLLFKGEDFRHTDIVPAL